MHAAVGPAIATACLAASAGWALTRPAAEPARPAAVSWTQTPEHVYVHVRNPNRTWGLRAQPVYVALHAKGYPVLRSYHPGDVRRLAGGGTFECCVIPYLPPVGDHTITLLPQRVDVEGVTVELRGGAGWVRMAVE